MRVLVSVLLLLGVIRAQSYFIPADAVSEGGAASQSSNYILLDAIGQPVIGRSAGASYLEYCGFFHFVAFSEFMGVEERAQSARLETIYDLRQAYPNPATGKAVIKYSVAKNTRACLKIYDAAGRLVRTLVDTRAEKGRHTCVWDGRDESGRRVSAGVYFYRLETPAYSSSRKIVITR